MYIRSLNSGIRASKYEVEKEIRCLILAGKKPEVLKKVANLTGASLRISKDYIGMRRSVQEVG